MDRPVAYFLSWRCYAGWLPGDARGWTDRRHNRFRTPHRPPRKALESHVKSTLPHPPYILSSIARETVTRAIEAECRHRGWRLHALNVRTNHVHCVLTAPGVKPEKVTQQLKAYATRALRRAGLAGSARPVWARHASTRYVWNSSQLGRARMYTLDAQ